MTAKTADGGDLKVTGVDHDARLDLALEHVFSEAADPMLILDLDGRVLEMNQEAEETFRHRREDVLGQSITVLVPADRHEETRELLNRCQQGERAQNIETVWRKGDLGEFPALTTVSLITDDEGNATAFTTNTRDISELKRTQRALRAQRAQLAEEARLTTVGELAAGLAHELNQPLAAIGHYCDAALLVAQPDDSELVQLIRAAYEQSLRAGDIIRNLRGLIGRTPPKRTSEDLNELVSTTGRFMNAEIRLRGARLNLSLADNLPRVVVNRIEIQQVIVNLILNGLQAMEAVEKSARRLGIQTALVDDKVRVSVQDTGPGIDPEIEAKLFAPFETSKPEGLGLGLWICESILFAHDGRIWAEPSDGGGAIFRFSLPVAEE